MDRVRETGVECVVTKHGEPVAKLVPYTARQPKPLFGSMNGTVLKYDGPSIRSTASGISIATSRLDRLDS